MPWSTWDEVPEEPVLDKPWFLEVFAGTARLTMAVLLHTAMRVLPPISFVVSSVARASFDVLCSPNVAKVLRWIAAGAILVVHFAHHAQLSPEPGGSMVGPHPFETCSISWDCQDSDQETRQKLTKATPLSD